MFFVFSFPMEQAPESENKIACRVCGQVHDFESPRPGWFATCQRCGATLAKRTTESLDFTAAFSLAALLLYAPANIFPILRMNLYGASQDNTVWQGCVRLYQDGDWIIAVVVFLASIFVPFLKILGLFFLAISTRFHFSKMKRVRTRIFVLVELLGRWAMLDVFVLAILVSLVKLSRLATIIAGSGAIAFSGVVVFTLLASACFDPQLIWNPTENYEPETHL
jgi:paraquat-inducible protein A